MNLIVRIALWVLLCCFPLGAAAHELQDVSEAYQTWANNAETTDEAYARLGWRKCCNHAEVFRTKFVPFKENGADGYLYLTEAGTWKRIPADVIHWDKSAPDGRPTLFIYKGKETCFFVAQGGI